ncbi:MAG TPA: hypothetical protein VGI39_13745 [Polyangiaceae bacterium]|jgi:hypothetical protein
MSKSFGGRWRDERLDDLLASVVLHPRLRALVEAPLVRKAGSLSLEPLVANATGPEALHDRTGYEAFLNKVHVEDFIDDTGGGEPLGTLIRQGVKAAVELSRRLESEGRFRVLLSLDPDLPTMTLRFFGRRDGEAWGAEDPDAFQLEEVLMIDTGS